MSHVVDEEPDMRTLNFIEKQYAALFVRMRFLRENHIFTHLTMTEKYILYRLAQATRGDVFVEIGSYLGASSCFIAAAISRCNPQKALYCVDTWENDAMTEDKKDTYHLFCEHTKYYRAVITALRGRSSEVGATFQKTVDFLFIDGDHSYEGVKRDVDTWLPKLAPNGLIIFHDIGWAEGVQRVVSEIIVPQASGQGKLPNLYWAWIA